jgi:O-antigen/teichoic acid export membrane protein
MSELSTLKRHSSHYVLGRIGLLFFGFVSFPLLTRIFSVAEYGEMNLIFRIVVCFVVLSKLGIQNSVVRFYEERVQKEGGGSAIGYYSTLFFGTVGLAGLVTLLFAITAWLLPSSMLSPGLKGFLSLCSLLILIRAEWSILSGFLQAEGSTKLYNFLDVGIKAGSILVICLLLFTWQKSLTAFFVGTIAVEAVVAAIVIGILVYRNVLAWNAFNWEFLQTVLAFGFPLVAYEISSVILDSGDRLLIQNYLGAEQLGYYSAAYNLSSYAQISLMVPINLAIIPIYMKLWVNKGKEETQIFLSKSLDMFLFVAVGMCCVVTLISRDLVIFLASKKFESSYRLLPILIVGLFIYSVHIFLTAGLLIYKKTFLMARQVIYATLLNIGLNVILLPRIGLTGAAWATLLSYTFLIVLMVHASFPLLPIQIKYVAFLRYVCAAVLAYWLVAQIRLDSAFWEIVVRGLLGVILYCGVLWIVDRQVREAVAAFVRDWLHRPGGRQSSPLFVASTNPSGRGRNE